MLPDEFRTPTQVKNAWIASEPHEDEDSTPPPGLEMAWRRANYLSHREHASAHPWRLDPGITAVTDRRNVSAE